jgi:hypothetical protein
MSTPSGRESKLKGPSEEAGPGVASVRSTLWRNLLGEQRVSADSEPPASPDGQGQLSNVQSGFLSLGAVLVISGMLLSLLFPHVPWTVRLLAAAVIFLSLRHWGGILVLVAVQLDLLAREGRLMNHLAGPSGLLYAFCVVAVLMFIARHRDALQEISRKDVRKLIRGYFSGSPEQKSVAGRETETDPIDGFLRVLASALRGLLLLLACATIARFVLDRVPRGRAFSLQLRDFVVANPELTGVSLLLVGVIATVLVLTEIGWRQMTAAQGRVYLRSALLKQMYRDLRMVTIQRIRLRQKTHGRASVEAKKPLE